MKNLFHPYFKLLTIVAFIFVIGIPLASATVGGPSYIGNFTYNKADESVYYVLSSASGRGCPPELYKISLETEAVTRVFSCDQGEKIVGNDYTQGDNLVMAEIQKITNSFKNISPISLPKNNIQVDVKFLKSETMEGDSSWIIRSRFTATVFQNGIQIDQFPLSGCNIEQPFTIAGYALPGFEKKILLLISTKSDCWEGGYTGESLYVIGGVSGLNKTSVNDYKSNLSPLIPSESTLVVYERDVVTPAQMATTTTPGTSEEAGGNSKLLQNIKIALLVIIALALGLVVGRTFRGKTVR